MVKNKLLFIVLLLVALLAVMFSSLNIKDRSIREVYEDLTFMRISLEARQYISQVEYDIKYGRQLDNFYDMQETLKGVQSCSSYMEGAYIVSASAKLLYQSGLKEGISLNIPKDQEYSTGKLFIMEEDVGYYYLTNPIKDGSGKIVGYLIMCIGKNAVSNAVSEYNLQNKEQTAMIVLEIFGVNLFILSRLRPNKKNQVALKLMLVLSITVTVAAALDSGVVLARFYQVVNDAAHQSADKMAQALQSEVDSVIAKGVSADRIYDLNGWLAKSSSELTIVTSLTLDRNQKISATVSQAYINSYFNKFLLRISLLLLTCALGGFVACRTVILFSRPKANGREPAVGKGAVHV
ncbi:MAG: hypothetical protein APF81_15310 [Desulfosporosinus sp. BRH_c37]|nr:MAG: hypothetical protein APF81_15310 [Desulfosporosinus sp. BRH_c37]